MVHAIGTDEAIRLHAEGAQFVDVLGTSEFHDAHLPGAIHIPLRRLDAQAPERLDRAPPVVVYCFDYQ